MNDIAKRHSHLSETRNAALGAGLLLVVTAAYWASERLFPSLWSDRPDLYVYVGRPLLWLVVGALSFVVWRVLPDRPRFDRRLTLAAGFVGLFHVSVLIIAGVAQGFAPSAVAGRLAAYPGNFFALFALLIGLEAARSSVLWSWRALGRQAAFGLTTLAFFIPTVPLAQFGGLGEPGRMLLVGGLLLLPALGVSIVATWLAARGGMWPAFAYVFVVRGFVELSPSVPDLSWPWSALLGLVVPGLSILLVRHIHAYVDPESEPTDQQFRIVHVSGKLSVAATAVAVLAIIAFGTGIFGVKPYVVSGTSMEPTYRSGDVVVVGPVKPGTLSVGDVVRFELHSLSVLHRVVEIEVVDGVQSIVTQGDRNGRPDPPLSADEVDGRVVYVLPGPQTILAWFRGDL